MTGLLEHDRAAVERRVDEVDRAAGDLRAVGERVADGVAARERRQQRGVGVQDPARERGEHRRADEAHVAGEDDDVDRRPPRASRRAPRRRSRALAVGAGAAEAREQRRLDPLLRRPGERRAVAIGEDERDLAAELAASRGGHERAEVAAGARDADRDAARSRAAPTGTAVRPRDRRSGPSAYRPPSSAAGTTSPTRIASGSAPRSAGAAAGVDDHDHPEAAVERRPDLGLLEAAERADQPHHRRHRPAPSGRAGRRGPPGSARGTLPGRPPPVMWATPAQVVARRRGARARASRTRRA